MCDSIESWKMIDNLYQTPIERLLKMIQHFSLGYLYAAEYKLDGQCRWKMHISKSLSIKGKAEGRYNKFVKEQANIKLMDVFEFVFYNEIPEPMEIDDDQPLWNPVGIEKQWLDQNNCLIYFNEKKDSGELRFDSNITIYNLIEILFF